MSEEWVAFGAIDSDDLSKVRDIHIEERMTNFYITRERRKVKLIISVDDDGDFMGWFDEGKDKPVMIQRKEIFDIQFAYGYRASEERGQGKAVRLSIRDVEVV